jgi:hypothetical protein
MNPARSRKHLRVPVFAAVQYDTLCDTVSAFEIVAPM